MATEASNRIKYALATKLIDFANDVFKIILMQSGFSFDKDGHHGYSNVVGSELATANGYTLGGYTMTGVAVTENDLDDRTEVTWDSAVWTASGGPIGPTPGAILYDDTATDDPLVAYIDFGGDQTQADGGVLTIANVEVRIL